MGAALPGWINSEQKWKRERLQMKKTNGEFIRFDKLEMSWWEEVDSVWNSLEILFQQTIGEGDYTVEWPPKSKELGNTGATEIVWTQAVAVKNGSFTLGLGLG